MFGQYKQLLYHGMSHERDSKLYANHNIPEDCGIEITKPFYFNHNSQKLNVWKINNNTQYCIILVALENFAIDIETCVYYHYWQKYSTKALLDG